MHLRLNSQLLQVPQDGQKLIRIPWHVPGIYPIVGNLV
jgi:hypothetical protein